MKAFIDTNVLIDLLAKREGFYAEAFRIFAMVYDRRIEAAVASMSFATASYVLSKHLKRQDVAAALRAIETLVDVVAIDRQIVKYSIAADNGFEDIEDAMQHEAALAASCDVIVTRNPKDFSHSCIKVLTPTDFLTQLTHNN